MSEYQRAYRDITQIIESVARQKNPGQRLRDLNSLHLAVNRELMDARNSAAYEVRLTYSMMDAATVTGIASRTIRGWTAAAIKRFDLPRLKRLDAQDLEGAVLVDRDALIAQSAPATKEE